MLRNLLFLTIFFILGFNQAHAITYYLKTNNPTSNWNDPCNWYTNPNNIGASDCMGYPGASDSVIINGHSFITLQNHTTIASLFMNNGYGWINGNYNLTVLFDATVDHMSIQNNGKIFILGNLFLEGTLAGSDSAFVSGTCYFDGAGISGGRTLVLSGMGGEWRRGDIGLSYGGKLVIPAGHSLNVTHESGSPSMFHASGGYFYNYGTLSKTSHQPLTLGAYNIGTGGTYNFMSGETSFTNNLTCNNCQINVADHARLEFLNGNHYFYGTGLSSEGYILAAGNLFEKKFDANCSLHNDTLQLASGTWSFYCPMEIPNLLVTGGTSILYAPVSITQSFWWSGGSLKGSAHITCYPEAHLLGSGSNRGTSCQFDFLDGMEWTGGNYIFDSGAAFNFPKNTTFLINLNSYWKFDRSTSATPTGVVNTLGKVIKTGPGTASLNLYFNTIDSILVEEGTLNLFRGTHNGSYLKINSGQTVQCTQAGNNFYHATITGLGTFRETAFNSLIDSTSTLDCHLEIINGTLTVNSDITPFSLLISGGTLNGRGDILCAGNFDWTGAGLIYNSSVITVNGFSTLSGTGGRPLQKEIIMNGGGSWTGSFYLNFGSTGIIRIPANTVLTLSPTTTINNQGVQNAVCGIIVEGTLRKTSAFEFDFQGADLSNNGVIEAIGSFRTWNYAFVHPNTGLLSPGLPGQVGTLAWNGLFENKPSGNLVFDCQYSSGKILHDSLHLYHNLTLGGSLTLNADPSWPGGNFTILSWAGTKTGSFSNVSLPAGYSLVVDDAAKKIRIVHVVSNPQARTFRDHSSSNLPGEALPDDANERSEGNSPDAPTDISLSLYPNPASDLLQVRINESGIDAEIRLIDSSGRQVFTRKIGAAAGCNIPVSELPSGLYWLFWTNGAQKAQKAVMIGKQG